MGVSMRCRLEVDAAAAGRARALVVDALSDTAWAGMTDTASLLVSELVTNAVLYGRPPLELELTFADRELAACVHDTNGELPSYSGSLDVYAEGGRGLLLVDQFATRWGAEVDGRRKRVWFVLERG